MNGRFGKMSGMSGLLRMALVGVMALVFGMAGFVASADAAVYQLRFDSTTNVGVDGTTNLAAQATAPTARTVMETTLTTAGSSYRPTTGMANGTWVTLIRAYANPAYTTSPIQLSNISGSYAIRGYNATDQWTFHLYDYDPAGAAGNKTLVATSQTITSGTGGTVQVQPTYTINNDTLPQGHRLLLEIAYRPGGNTLTPRVYLDGTTTTSQSRLTVTETPVSLCAATAPSNLSGSDAAGAPVEVNLSWTADCANNNTYTVYRDGVARPAGTNLTCSAGTMNFTDAFVDASTAYAYTVRGTNTAGACESADSNTANVTTNACSESQPSIIWTAQSSASGDFSGTPFVNLTNVSPASMEYKVTETTAGAGVVTRIGNWSAGSYNTIPTSYTVPADTIGASDRILMIAVSAEDAGLVDVTGITYGGQALTMVAQATQGTGYSNNTRVGYCDEACISAAVGTNIVPTFAGAYIDVVIFAGTYQGVDQVTPITSFDFNALASDPITASVTAAEGDQVFYAVEFNGSETNVPSTGFTQSAFYDTAGTGFTFAVNDRNVTTAGTVNISADSGGSTSNRTTIVAVALNAGAGVVETELIPWTADPPGPIPGVANLTNGNTYNLYARGLSSTCGVAYFGDTVANAVTPGTPTTFTWSSCNETSTLTLTPIANPITGNVTVTATGTATGIQVGTSPSPTNASGWTYVPAQDDNTTTVSFYATGTGTCGTISRSQLNVATNTMAAPVVTAFVIPATVTSTFVVPVTTFTATDNKAVTGYMITTSATAPAAGAAGWSGTAPASYTVGGYASYTLYAWAKDAAGNVSLSASAPVTVSSCVETATVTLNALPNPITGAVAVSATLGGSGGSAAQVSFDNGSTWFPSGTTFTPTAQANYSLQFAAKATGSCGGEIFAAANPTTVNVDSRTNGLEALGATAVQSGLNSIGISMSYCGDKNGNATFKVDYKLTSSGTWTNGTATLDASNDGSYTTTITGLTTGASYDVRMTYADADGILAGTAVETAVVTLVSWSDNPMLHNSNRFAGTTKHGGSWGTPGNYAGGITCATCHEKNSSNIKRVRATISYPDGSAMPGGGTNTAVVLASTTGFGDDTTAPRASSNKVCEACHTYDAAQLNGVQYHAANQSVASGHKDNSDCIGCHAHKAGFKADCSACHGNPPTANTFGGPNGLNDAVRTGSTTHGKHDEHVLTLGYSCNTCHTGWENADEMPDQTVSARINLGFNAFGDTTATYNGRNKVNGYKAAAGTTVTTAATLTCSAIYCHGTATPKWDDTVPAVACGSCHGNVNGAPIETAGDGDLTGATTGTKVGKHVKHIAKYACTLCHNGAGHGTALHVNGTNNIIFDTASAGASATFTAGTSTCSNLSCHENAVWNTSSPALGCDSCHGYPPTSSSDPANNRHVGVTPVNHDKSVAGSTTAVTANHQECNTCHGKSLANGETNNVAAGGDQYLSTYHIDGNIEMNGWATDSGQDTQYNQTNWGCAKACHANTAAYQLSDSGMTVQLHRYGAGGCNGCHDAGTGGAPVVTAASSHTDADGAGGTYAAGTCTDCHPGGTRGVMHAKNGDANVIAIANNTTVGINYTHLVDTGVNGFVLGGDATTGTTQAQICWNCHDLRGISEWGANNKANTGSSPYNYGTLTTSNWTTATWSSSRTQFAYKTGAIQSTHTANPLVTDANLAGANYSKTGSPNAVADIRCTNCHDVHNLNKAPGDTVTGAPYLRGSWRGNPYEEDGAPRSSYANTTYFSTAAEEFGQVPRGIITVQKIGGYWIDQNNMVPMSSTAAAAGTAALNPTSTWTVDQFGGLCALCHGGGNASWTATEIDNIDQKTGEALWMGTNGHANSVKGGTGSGSANSTNVFTARNGVTTYPGHNPRQHYFGQTDPADNGTYGFRSANTAALRYLPALQGSNTRPQSYLDTMDRWVVDETGATNQNQYHKFSCSKCHNPHASRLPKLMITNCLDTVHNTWDNQFQMVTAASTQNNNRELAQWTSAQNCHRYSESNNTTTTTPEYRLNRVASPAGAGAGWNKVTPWKQTLNVP